MHTLTGKTVREIALEAPLTARVFEEFNMDFCCKGRVPFVDACESAGVDPEMVFAKLRPILENVQADDSAADRMGPTELIDHIVATHHVFTVNEIHRLVLLSGKVATRHGDRDPALAEIRDDFNDLAEELIAHQRKEELMLFPYIKQLELAVNEGRAAATPPFGTASNPIRLMLYDHDNALEAMVKMRELSGEYTAPADACPKL
jgi:regulator of cell morphogenesis and NO signaling